MPKQNLKYSKALHWDSRLSNTIAALDNPNLMAPVMTIWTDAAPDWACFDPTLPKVGGQPPPPVVAK
jgi:hypothetical protein